jgi:hypothetical protein
MELSDWSHAEECSIHTVFDLAGQRLRFDTRLPVKVNDQVVRSDAILVLRPDLSIKWGSAPTGDPSVVIHPPRNERRMDIRAVGLEVVGAWLDGLNTLESMLTFYRENQLFAIEELDDGAVVKADFLHLQGPNNPGNQLDVVYRLWLDTALDYACIRHEALLCKTDGAGQITEIAPAPAASMDVGWEMRGGMAVPVSVRAWEGTSKRRDTYEFSIDWKQVNGSVQDPVFELSGLGLPGETAVIDARPEPAIDLGRLDKRVFSRPADLFPERGLGRAFLLAVNVALILIIVTILWFRRSRAERA